MTNRIRYGMGAALLFAAVLTGCAAPVQKVADQTGEPNTTASTTTTSTTTEPPLTAPASTTVPGPGGTRLVDGQAPKDRTVTITAGAFSPSTLTVAVGDTVTFVGGDNIASDLVVGELSSAVVTSGLVETYEFTQPGTVTVSTTGNTPTMTITVTGTATTVPESTTTVAGSTGGSTTTAPTDAGPTTTEPAVTTTTQG